MFDTLTGSFTAAMKKIRTFDDDKALKKALDELKKSLLKADVNHKVVKELNSSLNELVSMFEVKEKEMVQTKLLNEKLIKEKVELDKKL